MKPDKKGEDHPENSDDFPGLKVNPGIPFPPSINPDLGPNYPKLRRPERRVEDYLLGITEGDRSVLSQAITLVESARADHQIQAREIVAGCLPKAGNAIRVGITGVPGVGKSTFIESLGLAIVEQGHKLAVLAIDPSSERSRGSILGDKTRMEKLSVHPRAFIRPSPSGGSLGGVARKTRETVFLCEAAGFDVIFIETVGVGQSETAVHSMVDFFLLLMLAGAGDELQGIKRGIMEMADGIAITKADGTNEKKALIAKNQCENALRLFPPPPSGWTTGVDICSALTGFNILKVWEAILAFHQQVSESGWLSEKRRSQATWWMNETIQSALRDSFFQHPGVQKLMPRMEAEVSQGLVNSFDAAEQLLREYRST